MCLAASKLFVRTLFLEGIASVKPGKLIKSVLKMHNDKVVVNKKSYDLTNGKCYIVGFGKAVFGMAREVEAVLKGKLEKGILSLPEGMQVDKLSNSKLEIYNGASGNIPDEKSVLATKKILDLVEEARAEDLVLVMISGGGSALLTKPKAGISLIDKTNLINDLSRAGADIKELNTVRKRISDVKGGKLSERIYPASCVSLILSDIVGDPIDLIASGPTVRNDDSPEKAMMIIQKYNLENKISKSVKNALNEMSDSDTDEKIFERVENIVLGNNRIALERLQQVANDEGYTAIILSSRIEQNVNFLGSVYAELTKSVIKCLKGSNESYSEVDNILKRLHVDEHEIKEVSDAVRSGCGKLCLLLGGETVVNVSGSGIGGRNQELVLRFSNCLEKESDSSQNERDFSVVFLSGGSDGIDGPTTAAGAITYSGQLIKAKLQGLNANDFLNNNDSNSYFRKLDNREDLLEIGHTGVNVMDLHILIIERN